MQATKSNADLGDSFTLPGSSITLRRMGYGAMQLAGPHVFGSPADRDAAVFLRHETKGREHVGRTSPQRFRLEQVPDK